MIAPMAVEVGRPVRFTGYAEDYGVPIAAVQFSLDGGETWIDYDVSEYTPEVAGSYCLLVRSVNDRGEVSPEPDTASFTAFEPEEGLRG